MTRHARCGSAKPASACGPRSSRSNNPPICRRVASPMTRVFGAAKRLQPGGEVRGLADDRRAPVPRPRRSDRRPRRARWRCRAARANLLAPAIGRPPRSPPARRAPPARHRPHAPADSRNRSARRRPCIWRQSRRSGRPYRRPRGDSRRSVRADPPGHNRVDSAVEPTRSQNITVSWRRSASAGAGASGGRRRHGGHRGSECGNGVKQLAPVADRGTADARSDPRMSASAEPRNRSHCRGRQAHSAQGPSPAATPLRPCGDPPLRGAAALLGREYPVCLSTCQRQR